MRGGPAAACVLLLLKRSISLFYPPPTAFNIHFLSLSPSLLISDKKIDATENNNSDSPTLIRLAQIQAVGKQYKPA